MSFDMPFGSGGRSKETINQEIDTLVEPMDPQKPESVLFHFYLFILKGDCDQAWKLFSKYSQQKILDTTYDEMKETDEFYLQNEITSKGDLRKAFETNAPGLKGAFWLPFAMESYVDFIVELAEFQVRQIKTNKALLEIVFKRTDGLDVKIPINMVYEEASWRVGMVESVDDF